MMGLAHVVSITIGVVAVSYASGLLWSLLQLTLTVGFSGLGLYLGVACALNSDRKYTPSTAPLPELPTTALYHRMREARYQYKAPQKKVVTTHNLDCSLQEIAELIVDEFIVSWYKELATDEDRIKELLIHDIWGSIEIISERLSNIDMVSLLTKDLVEAVTEHLAAIKKSNLRKRSPHFEHFLLYPWLANVVKEEGLERRVAEVAVLYLLPAHYTATPAAAHLMRELLTTCVFVPTLSMMSAPDYINQKLYAWLLYREALDYEHRRTYMAAATYEEYMAMIEACRDVEHLKHMRYNIMSEIIHATSIQNLKRMQGQDITKEMPAKSTAKGDLLRARNLTRYLNQLAVCKKECEKQIHFHGGPDYKSYDDDHKRASHSKKILAFSVIMNSTEVRGEFYKFLKRLDKESLGHFWSAVTALKAEPGRAWHQSGNKIYHMYVVQPSSAVRALLDRSLIKGMEAFLVGNTGPEAFFTAQEIVYKSLEEKYYPSFIISDLYDNIVATLSDDAKMDSLESNIPGPSSKASPVAERKRKVVKDRERIEEHSTYAQEKLKALDQKLVNKSRALQALKMAQKPDQKVIRLQEDLQTEIDTLRNHRRLLDFHIERTNLWVDKIGGWKANICSHETIREKKRHVVYFTIVVSPANVSPTADTHGWVLTRKLEEFRMLHKQLYQIEPKLKQFSLPTTRRLKPGADNVLDKAKDTLEEYLQLVLSSASVAESELVYAFFSPSPEHLKQSGPPRPQKKGTFLSNIFSRLDHDDSDSDDEFIFADDER